MLIETERLLISKIGPEDADFIMQLLNTPSWIKYIGDRGIHSLDDARNYISSGPVKSYEQFGFGLYLVKLKASHTPIGMSGLLKREMLDSPDIGFAFMPDFTGQGYGLEAARAVLNYAEETFQIKRVLAITLLTNTSSIRLLEKLGMVFEKMIESANEELMLFSK